MPIERSSSSTRTRIGDPGTDALGGGAAAGAGSIASSAATGSVSAAPSTVLTRAPP
jgi:hypothetical protein